MNVTASRRRLAGAAMLALGSLSAGVSGWSAWNLAGVLFGTFIVRPIGEESSYAGWFQDVAPYAIATAAFLILAILATRRSSSLLGPGPTVRASA